jgi:hypothetical protein
MSKVTEYLASRLRRDDITLAPPCCANLETKYLDIFTNPKIKFCPVSGDFKEGTFILARFRNWQIIGGVRWELPDETFNQLILEKNPFHMAVDIGERNGLTIINNRLWAVALDLHGNYEIRRPVRQTHLPTNSSDILELFRKHQKQMVPQEI